MAQGSKGLRRRPGEGGVQRLLRVGARFPLVADRQLARDARNSNEVGFAGLTTLALTYD